MSTKYNVWFVDNEQRHKLHNQQTYGRWVDQGDGPMGIKTAERIARELNQDFGVRTCVLPAGQTPPPTKRDREEERQEEIADALAMARLAGFNAAAASPPYAPRNPYDDTKDPELAEAWDEGAMEGGINDHYHNGELIQ